MGACRKIQGALLQSAAAYAQAPQVANDLRLLSVDASSVGSGCSHVETGTYAVGFCLATPAVRPRKGGGHAPTLPPTFALPTPSVVQYMYNTCTIYVQLVNVQILYKYCTYIVQRTELVS